MTTSSSSSGELIHGFISAQDLTSHVHKYKETFHRERFGELRSLLHQPSWSHDELLSLCEPMIHHDPDTYRHTWLPYIQEACGRLEKFELTVTTQAQLEWHTCWLPFGTVHFKPRQANELFTAQRKLRWLELVSALTFKGASKRLITMCREADEVGHLNHLRYLDWNSIHTSHAQWVELMNMNFVDYLRHVGTVFMLEPTLYFMAKELRFPHLETLHLRCGFIQPEAFYVLDEAPWLPTLKALTLENYYLPEASLERLLSLEQMSHLTRLSLRGCTLLPAHMEALLHAPYAAHLTHLDVSSCQLDLNTLRMLVTSPLASRLQGLGLSDDACAMAHDHFNMSFKEFL